MATRGPARREALLLMMSALEKTSNRQSRADQPVLTSPSFSFRSALAPTTAWGPWRIFQAAEPIRKTRHERATPWRPPRDLRASTFNENLEQVEASVEDTDGVLPERGEVRLERLGSVANIPAIDDARCWVLFGACHQAFGFRGAALT